MLSTVLQVFSVVLTTCVAAYAIYSIRRRPPWIDELMNEGAEMIFKPDEEGHNMIDHLASRFFQSAKMSMLAGKSGEVRHEKMIEGRVFEAVMDKSPEMKLGMKVLNDLGLDDLATPENLPALLKIANKYGVFGMFQGNSPGKRPYGGRM